MANDKYSNWTRNFGKSLKFGSQNVLSETTPTMYDMATKISPSDILQSIKSIKDVNNMIGSTLLGKERFELLKKYGKVAYDNAKKDLKSGKLVADPNDEDESFGFGDDSDFDFGDDFGDFGSSSSSDDGFSVSVDEGSSSGSSSSSTPNSSSSSNNATPNKSAIPAGLYRAQATELKSGLGDVVKANNLSTQKLIELNMSVAEQTQMMSDAFQQQISTMRDVGANVIAVQQSVGSKQIEGLSSINDNIKKLVEFNNETMANFAMGSLQFYENSLKELQIITGPYKRPDKKKKGIENSDFTSVFAGDSPDFEAYKDVVMKNIRSFVDDSMFGMLLGFLDNEDMLKMMVQHPLSTLVEEGISYLIPKMVKGAMTSLDQSFKEFFPALIGKITAWGVDSDNPFMRAIGQIFGFKTKYGTGVNLANYEKGAIPFDGITKKAITEVIPTYLRKILSAISHRQEMAFDYSRGIFESVDEMRERRKNRDRQVYLSQGYDILSALKDFGSRHVQFDTQADRDKYNKDMENFVVNIGKAGGINVKDLNEYMVKGGLDKAMAQLVQKIMLSMNKSVQMQARSLGLKAQAEIYERNMREANREDQSGVNGVLFNGMQYEYNIKRDKNNRRYYRYRMDDQSQKYQNVISVDSDGNLLRNGVVVTDSGGNPIKAKEAKRRGVVTDTEWMNDRMEASGKSREDVAKQREEDRRNRNKSNNNQNPNKIVIGDDGSLETVSALMAQDKLNENPEEDETSLSSKVSRYFRKPQQMLVDMLNKVDNTLYNIIFGNDDGTSILEEAVKGIKRTFLSTRIWLMDNVFKPLKEKLFGENFKDTKVYKWGKNAMEKTQEYLFGTLDANGNRTGGLLSESFNEVKKMFGQSTEFLKSNVWGQVKTDMGKISTRFKAYFIGDEAAERAKNKKEPLIDTLFNTLGKGVQNFRDFLFGYKGMDDKTKAAAAESFTRDLKAKMPKAVGTGIMGAGIGAVAGLAGGWGLLGNLFLPGGPIGGLIVGTAIGFARQSEGFKRFIFGDEETGKGGIIPKKFQDWWSRNKTAIIGGGVLGAIKGILGMGMIPGFLSFIPGVGVANALFATALGPIFGGMALGLAYKSQAVQNLLFGKDTDPNTGKRIGGLLNNAASNKMKEMLPNVAVGAIGGALLSLPLSQMGVLGSFIFGGPLPMAILGAASGIAISSDKFRRMLFGYEDANGVIHGGLMDKMKNFISVEVLMPLKMSAVKYGFKIGTWFQNEVINPLSDAFYPLKAAMLKIGDEIKDYTKKLFGKIGESISNLFKPVKDNILGIFRQILAPLKWLLRRTTDTTFRLLRLATAMVVKPISLLGSATSGVLKGQAWKNAIGSSISNLGNVMVDSNQGLGARWNALKQVGSSIFNPGDVWRNDPYTRDIMRHQDAVKNPRKIQRKNQKTKARAIAAVEKQMENAQAYMRANGYSSSQEELKKQWEARKKRQQQVDDAYLKIVRNNKKAKNDPVVVATVKGNSITQKIREAGDIIRDNTTNMAKGIQDIYDWLVNGGKKKEEEKVQLISDDYMKQIDEMEGDTLEDKIANFRKKMILDSDENSEEYKKFDEWSRELNKKYGNGDENDYLDDKDEARVYKELYERQKEINKQWEETHKQQQEQNEAQQDQNQNTINNIQNQLNNLQNNINNQQNQGGQSTVAQQNQANNNSRNIINQNVPPPANGNLNVRGDEWYDSEGRLITDDILARSADYARRNSNQPAPNPSPFQNRFPPGFRPLDPVRADGSLSQRDLFRLGIARANAAGQGVLQRDTNNIINNLRNEFGDAQQNINDFEQINAQIRAMTGNNARTNNTQTQPNAGQAQPIPQQQQSSQSQQLTDAQRRALLNQQIFARMQANLSSQLNSGAQNIQPTSSPQPAPQLQPAPIVNNGPINQNIHSSMANQNTTGSNNPIQDQPDLIARRNAVMQRMMNQQTAQLNGVSEEEAARLNQQNGNNVINTIVPTPNNNNQQGQPRQEPDRQRRDITVLRQEDEERNIRETVMGHLGSLADDMDILANGDPRKHKKGLLGALTTGFDWMKSIVGGVITLGGSLIGLASNVLGPIGLGGMLLALYKQFTGDSETLGKGIGQDDRNERFIRKAAEMALRGVNVGAKYFGRVTASLGSYYAKTALAFKPIKSVTNALASGAKNIGGAVKNKAAQVTGSVTGKVAKGILAAQTKLYQSGTRALASAKNAAPDSGMIAKMKGVIEKALNNGTIQKILGAGWVKKARGFMSNLLQKIIQPKIWSKVAGLLTAKMAGKGLRVIGNFLFPFSAIAFGVYDGIDGFANAANLFRVSEDRVTIGMRAISAFVHIVCGLPLIPVVAIDLGLTVLSQALGWNFDHRTWLATQLYKFIATDEDAHELDKAQQDAMDAYTQYLNDNNMTEDDMTFQQYLDKTQGEGLFTTIYNKLAKGINNIGKAIYEEDENGNIKRLLGSENLGATFNKLGDLLNKGFQNVQMYFAKFIGNPKKFMFDLFGWDRLSPFRRALGQISDYFSKKVNDWKAALGLEVDNVNTLREQMGERVTDKDLNLKTNSGGQNTSAGSTKTGSLIKSMIGGSGKAGAIKAPKIEEYDKPAVVDAINRNPLTNTTRTSLGMIKSPAINSSKDLADTEVRETTKIRNDNFVGGGFFDTIKEVAKVMFDTSNGNSSINVAQRMQTGIDPTQNLQSQLAAQNDAQNRTATESNHAHVLRINDKDTGFAYYQQDAPAWNKAPLIPSVPELSMWTIGDWGCGPTSLAMVATQMRGTEITPIDTSKLVRKTDVVTSATGAGIIADNTDKDYFATAARSLGMYSDPVNNVDVLRNALASGYPVILGGSDTSDETSPFYTDTMPEAVNWTPFGAAHLMQDFIGRPAGHFVVAAGLSPEGNDLAYVYNPSASVGDSHGAETPNSVVPLSTLAKGVFENKGYARLFKNDNKSIDTGTNKKDLLSLMERWEKYGTCYEVLQGVDIDNLSNAAKKAMRVLSQYFYSLTKEKLVVSRGYDKSDKVYATGNVFNFKGKSDKLDQDENECRTKLINMAGRFGVQVQDHYDQVEGQKEEPYLRMDATTWLKREYKGGGKDAKKKKHMSIIDYLGRMGSFLTGFMTSMLSGERWNYQEWLAKQDGDQVTGGELSSDTDAQTNRQAAWKFLTEKQGYSRKVASAIMGNLEGESHFDTAALGDGGTSLGIAQWHESRKTALEEYAQSKGTNVTDIDTQMEYLQHELDTQFSGLTEEMEATDSLYAATDLFTRKFENPLDPDGVVPVRYSYAKTISDDESFVGGSGLLGTMDFAGLLKKKKSAEYDKPKQITRKQLDMKKKIFSGGAKTPPDYIKIDGSSPEFPYYSQYDSKWSSKSINPNGSINLGTIGDIGCAPTAMAMIISKEKGLPFDPEDASNYVQPTDISDGGVIATGDNDYFSRIASANGLGVNRITDSNALQQALTSNQGPVLLGGSSWNPLSPFFGSGHYVVADGVSTMDRDQVRVYNPSGSNGLKSIDDLISDSIGNGGIAIQFTKGTLSTLDVSSLGLKADDPCYKAASPKIESQINGLQSYAKAALRYVAQAFKLMTGRDLVVTRAFINGDSKYGSGYVFDVGDDSAHRTLEFNFNNTKSLLSYYAHRAGIVVADHYIVNRLDNSVGYLEMNALNFNGGSLEDLQKCKDNFKEDNGNYTTVGGAAAKGTGGIETLSGDGNRQQAWNYLIKQGWGRNATAAIMASLEQESHFDPTAVNSSGHSGIAQWDPDHRFQNLKEFAAQNGGDPWALNTQLAFLVKEINDGYMESIGRMQRTDLRDATRIFIHDFERPGDTETEVERRYPYAQSFYNDPAFVGGGYANVIKGAKKYLNPKNFSGGYGVAPKDAKVSDKSTPMKVYTQTDPEWASQPMMYDHPELGTLGDKGCGPTAAAMVVSQLKGINFDPQDAAQILHTEDIGELGVKGSSEYFTRVGYYKGLATEVLDKNDDLKAYAQSGTPMIIGGRSMNPDSPLYGDGHYVVLAGTSPYNSDYGETFSPSGTYKDWSLDTLKNEMVVGWRYANSSSPGSDAANGANGNTVNAATGKAAAPKPKKTGIEGWGDRLSSFFSAFTKAKMNGEKWDYQKWLNSYNSTTSSVMGAASGNGANVGDLGPAGNGVFRNDIIKEDPNKWYGMTAPTRSFINALTKRYHDKTGDTVVLSSGYRPNDTGSKHSLGIAFDVWSDAWDTNTAWQDVYTGIAEAMGGTPLNEYANTHPENHAMYASGDNIHVTVSNQNMDYGGGDFAGSGEGFSGGSTISYTSPGGYVSPTLKGESTVGTNSNKKKQSNPILKWLNHMGIGNSEETPKEKREYKYKNNNMPIYTNEEVARQNKVKAQAKKDPFGIKGILASIGLGNSPENPKFSKKKNAKNTKGVIPASKDATRIMKAEELPIPATSNNRQLSQEELNKVKEANNGKEKDVQGIEDNQKINEILTKEALKESKFYNNNFSELKKEFRFWGKDRTKALKKTTRAFKKTQKYNARHPRGNGPIQQRWNTYLNAFSGTDTSKKLMQGPKNSVIKDQLAQLRQTQEANKQAALNMVTKDTASLSFKDRIKGIIQNDHDRIANKLATNSYGASLVKAYQNKTNADIEREKKMYTDIDLRSHEQAKTDLSPDVPDSMKIQPGDSAEVIGGKLRAQRKFLAPKEEAKPSAVQIPSRDQNQGKGSEEALADKLKKELYDKETPYDWVGKPNLLKNIGGFNNIFPDLKKEVQNVSISESAKAQAEAAATETGQKPLPKGYVYKDGKIIEESTGREMKWHDGSDVNLLYADGKPGKPNAPLVKISQEAVDNAKADAAKQEAQTSTTAAEGSTGTQVVQPTEEELASLRQKFDAKKLAQLAPLQPDIRAKELKKLGLTEDEYKYLVFGIKPKAKVVQTPTKEEVDATKAEAEKQANAQTSTTTTTNATTTATKDEVAKAKEEAAKQEAAIASKASATVPADTGSSQAAVSGTEATATQQAHNSPVVGRTETVTSGAGGIGNFGDIISAINGSSIKSEAGQMVAYLKAISEKMGLKVDSTTGVTRQGNTPPVTPPTQTPVSSNTPPTPREGQVDTLKGDPVEAANPLMSQNSTKGAEAKWNKAMEISSGKPLYEKSK